MIRVFTLHRKKLIKRVMQHFIMAAVNLQLDCYWLMIMKYFSKCIRLVFKLVSGQFSAHYCLAVLFEPNEPYLGNRFSTFQLSRLHNIKRPCNVNNYQLKLNLYFCPLLIFFLIDFVTSRLLQSYIQK